MSGNLADTEGDGCTSEDEEEEILVYVQFESQLDNNILRPETFFKFLGLDSERPVLQLGDQVFEGKWRDTIGTAVFFEEDSSDALARDPIFSKVPTLPLKYLSKTQKSLVMSRSFLTSKDQNTKENETNASVIGTMEIEDPSDMDTYSEPKEPESNTN